MGFVGIEAHTFYHLYDLSIGYPLYHCITSVASMFRRKEKVECRTFEDASALLLSNDTAAILLAQQV